jgi:hypothetical protein
MVFVINAKVAIETQTTAALLLLRIEYQTHISCYKIQSRINYNRENLIIHLGSGAFNV